MSLGEDVAALQGRITAAQRDRARAEGARDAAQAAADKARVELLKDFGVSTVEDAESLLVQLRAELADLTETLNTKLNEIGV